MKNLSRLNLVSRIFFLLLTPVLFRFLTIGFIWHSIYWGAITFVVLMWGFFILISPLFGRIGCGWLCFMGTIQDFTFGYSFFKIKRKKPILWLRFLIPVQFFVSAFIFFFIRLKNGNIEGFRFAPFFLDNDFNIHYKLIWMYDIMGAIVLGLLLEKRWACKNLCYMGSLCAIGSTYSRLIPVIDTKTCTNCGKCDAICPVSIPITSYLENKAGLVTDSECILCGKCIEPCSKNAIQIKFVWNRKKYLKTYSKTLDFS